MTLVLRETNQETQAVFSPTFFYAHFEVSYETRLMETAKFNIFLIVSVNTFKEEMETHLWIKVWSSEFFPVQTSSVEGRTVSLTWPVRGTPGWDGSGGTLPIHRWVLASPKAQNSETFGCLSFRQNEICGFIWVHQNHKGFPLLSHHSSCVLTTRPHFHIPFHIHTHISELVFQRRLSRTGPYVNQ